MEEQKEDEPPPKPFKMDIYGSTWESELEEEPSPDVKPFRMDTFGATWDTDPAYLTDTAMEMMDTGKGKISPFFFICVLAYIRGHVCPLVGWSVCLLSDPPYILTLIYIQSIIH